MEQKHEKQNHRLQSNYLIFADDNDVEMEEALDLLDDAEDESPESDPKLGPNSKAFVKLSRLDRHIADTASQFRQEGRKRRRASSADSEGSRKKRMRRDGTLHINSR